ncbi:MAG: hypothetical protein HRU20_00515 [Pseudomonadales bacterium]|nr:hypothetical protein [Pseudomonadales bacterium]
MSLLKNIQELLKKNCISFETDISKIGSESDLLEIFEKLTPTRFLQYDPECIDCIENYIYVLGQHAEITQGEFSPENISVKGSIEKTITLEFLHNGKAKKLKINQDSSTWVTDSFDEKLFSFCKKELQGNFLILPSYDQMAAAVYLPKKVVTKIQKTFLGMEDADAIVDYIVNGGCPTTINWEYTLPAAFNGYTSKGETVATAVIKAKIPDTVGNIYHPYTFTEGVFEQFMNGLPINLSLQNKFGETPYQISLEGDSEFLKNLLGKKGEFCIKFSEIYYRKHLELSANILSLLEPLKENLEGMFFHKYSYSGKLSFSSVENCIEGENVFNIFSRDNGSEVTYDIFAQKAGNEENTIIETYRSDKIDDIRELIESYCNNTLWN